MQLPLQDRVIAVLGQQRLAVLSAGLAKAEAGRHDGGCVCVVWCSGLTHGWRCCWNRAASRLPSIKMSSSQAGCVGVTSSVGQDWQEGTSFWRVAIRRDFWHGFLRGTSASDNRGSRVWLVQHRHPLSASAPAAEIRLVSGRLSVLSLLGPMA
ncbi:uncharacterized protein K452DRAFT_6564 [Aplosporella prunicola CBS 121167]|uniref:Uncharacterized protein n=1 Tax=Aplosporella prunicola CBS 121167 TaxID=1176127 RepID=A0A6A6BWV5_9PEZI|nr:uncharacterized protein K452DRAFT_6564 [Aplosporella prunicola CBS 121167]KAF2147387.1 hypothetical protein K452DRAFT_6564 [Aplosporella prunicola CBS 121167]